MNFEDNINQGEQGFQEGNQQSMGNESRPIPSDETGLSGVEPPRAFAKGGGKETLYRVTVRGQVSIIGIMDKKANLIISINTLLITGALGLLTGSFFYELQHNKLALFNHVPLVVLLIFSVVAMTFAILSTRTDLSINKFRERFSPLQFTLSHDNDMTLDAFLQKMETVLASNEMIYENLNTDLYFLSKVIARKSYFLNIAYILFVLGLVGAVGLFLILNI
jgi:hypothetical protein